MRLLTDMQSAIRMAQDRWYHFDPDRSFDFGTHSIWQAPLVKTKFSTISADEARSRIELAGELWLMNFDIETDRLLTIYCPSTLELRSFSRQGLAAPATRSCTGCEISDLTLWEKFSPIVYFKQVAISRTDDVP